MEAFYAVNGFTLLIFAGILITKIKMQARQIANMRQAEIEDLKRKVEAQDRIVAQHQSAAIQQEDAEKKASMHL